MAVRKPSQLPSFSARASALSRPGQLQKNSWRCQRSSWPGSTDYMAPTLHILHFTRFLFLPRRNCSWLVWLAIKLSTLLVQGKSRKCMISLAIFSGSRLRSSYLRAMIDPGNLTDNLLAASKSAVSWSQATFGFQHRGLTLQSCAKGRCIRELNTPRGSRTSRIT